MRPHSPPDSLLFAGLLEDLPVVPDFRYEKRLIRDGFELVAGLDEAGRGPLAGPVVAACVVLDPRNIPDGLNDSKAMTAQARERLYELILASAHVAIASASAAEIDRTNILIASLGCMRRALNSLHARPLYALIDGRDVPPGLACPAKALIKGDARSLSIAAASIVAKVTRDRMMSRSCVQHPAYGFSRHMGYGTLEHREAITRHGPCGLHRMSFRPLRPE